MTTEELQTIFTKLRDQTLKKELKWKAINDNTLRIDFPRSSIMFHRNPRLYPQLSILNSGGSTVAEITFESFHTSAATAKDLNLMWKTAYEIAYQTDETVQDILSKLGGS